MKERIFDLDGIYQKDVIRIRAAHEEAKIIHAAGDIRSSGDQVEKSIRRIVSARLPHRCRIAHGHILDSSCHVSPQLDVIICDGLGSPGLFQAADGTEFVPYESVYAIGEVKSTYYKADTPIHRFSEVISATQAQLSRNTTQRNPLLSFMFFIGASDFQTTDIEELYCSSAVDSLPSVVCFLDQGVLCHSRILRNGYGTPIPVAYHLCPARDAKPGGENHWTLLSWEKDSAARNLMFLQVVLSQHVETCRLDTPNLHRYLLQYIGTPTSWTIIRDDQDAGSIALEEGEERE